MSEEREKDSSNERPRRSSLSERKCRVQKTCPSIFILESDGRITEELNPNFLESVSDQTL